MKRNCICAECGCTFEGGPRAWYCPDCREERKSERSRNRPKVADRPLGSEDVCVRCGEKYIVNSGLQKYCPKCAYPAVREIDRKQGKEYYHQNKSHRNPIKNAKRRKPPMRICVICGKEFAHNHTVRITCSPECRRRDKNNKCNAWEKAKRAKAKQEKKIQNKTTKRKKTNVEMTYEATKSIMKTAKICGISYAKVKKFLLESGYKIAGRASQIKKMLDENKSIDEIAEVLGMSTKNVNSNMPYIKTEYGKPDASPNAMNIRKMRDRRKSKPDGGEK